MPLTTLNSPESDVDPTLSADSRVIVFASNRTTGWYLYISERTSTDQDFPAPRRITEIDDTICACSDPSLSADGLTMTFSAGYYFVSTRSARGQPWSTPRRLNGVLAAADVHGVGLSPDGLSIVFADNTVAASGASLFVASRLTADAEFAMAVQLASVATPWAEQYPSLSRDGLEVWFQVDRANTRIFFATRENPTDPFSTPTQVSSLGSALSPSDPEISADKRTLYFDQETAPGRNVDLVMAPRQCP